MHTQTSLCRPSESPAQTCAWLSCRQSPAGRVGDPSTYSCQHQRGLAGIHTHTHIRLTALCPGLPGWAGTRKVKPIWILLKQEIVSGSGISWAICKSAPRSRQITTPAPHCSVFYRPDALPVTEPTASKHWRTSIHATETTICLMVLFLHTSWCQKIIHFLTTCLCVCSYYTSLTFSISHT